MNVLAYTEHPEVVAMIEELRAQFAAQPGGMQISSIRDAAGYQYVDLVMEGGGTLGVALLGYIYMLEKMDIRFLQIAGTSAGSICALLLAAAGPIQQYKSGWLIEKVASKDFYDFVDGDEDIHAFIETMFDENAKKRQKAAVTAPILDDIKAYYGLNPGQHFHDWLTGLLQEKGIRSLDDLQAMRKTAPEGINCSVSRWERFAVVTAEVTTGTKIAFPDAAHLYYQHPGAANPADFVRASMSVPVFFYPFKLANIPQDAERAPQWAAVANYHGPIPPEAYFVDGGAMSNFPLSLLYDHAKADGAPVLGIKIGKDRDSYQSCDSFGSFAGALLGSMMAFYDNDFIVQNPEIADKVGVIDTGPYHWLDFSIPEEGKIDLFVRGARAAFHFLCNYQSPMV